MLAANCAATLPSITEAHFLPIMVRYRLCRAFSSPALLANGLLGEFVRNDLVPYTRSLRSEMPGCIPEEEADRFLEFLKRMLCWLPEERATARELKNDPWFDDDDV